MAPECTNTMAHIEWSAQKPADRRVVHSAQRDWRPGNAQAVKPEVFRGVSMELLSHIAVFAAVHCNLVINPLTSSPKPTLYCVPSEKTAHNRCPYFRGSLCASFASNSAAGKLVHILLITFV